MIAEPSGAVNLGSRHKATNRQFRIHTQIPHRQKIQQSKRSDGGGIIGDVVTFLEYPIETTQDAAQPVRYMWTLAWYSEITYVMGRKGSSVENDPISSELYMASARTAEYLALHLWHILIELPFKMTFDAFRRAASDPCEFVASAVVSIWETESDQLDKTESEGRPD